MYQLSAGLVLVSMCYWTCISSTRNTRPDSKPFAQARLEEAVKVGMNHDEVALVLGPVFKRLPDPEVGSVRSRRVYLYRRREWYEPNTIHTIEVAFTLREQVVSRRLIVSQPDPRTVLKRLWEAFEEL